MRKIYKAYQQTQSIAELISALETMQTAFGNEGYAIAASRNGKQLPKLVREDLRLICFDVLSDGEV